MTQRIVVLGGGWAGFHLLKDIDDKKFETVIVDECGYMTMTPFLPSYLVGAKTKNSIVSNIRGLFMNSITGSRKLIKGKVQAIDPLAKTITVNKIPYSYDKLVVAGGAEPNYMVPGSGDHLYPINTLETADVIRKELDKKMEDLEFERRPGPLKIVTFGAGPAGVEVTAALANNVDYFCRRFNTLKPKDFKFTLIDMAPRVLPIFTQKSSDFCYRILSKVLGVDVQVKTKTLNITKDEMTLQDLTTGEIRKEKYDLGIWTSGVKCSTPIVDMLKIMGQKNPERGIIVKPNFQSPEHPEIYGIGDSCNVETGKLMNYINIIPENVTCVNDIKKALINKDIDPMEFCQLYSNDSVREHGVGLKEYLSNLDKSWRGYPKTGQVAKLQGRALAYNLNNDKTNPQYIKGQGVMVKLANRGACIELSQGIVICNSHAARVFYNAGYFFKAISVKQRLSILSDGIANLWKNIYIKL